ncbi:MAG: IS4 family transposase, partial [Spirochaetales bacterium]|nr:IS4 family transposase [Spirochaetales bacterium]
MCTYRSSISVWLEVLSGNANDKVTFRKSIQRYREQLQDKQLPYFVADSALYTAEGLKELHEVRWVTRVPETLKEAKQRIAA